MSWETLSPIVRIAPRMQVALFRLKDGIPRLRLTFSETFMKELGNPKAADVMAGSGENAGKVLVRLNPKGAFEFQTIGEHCFRLVVPGPTDAPPGDRAAMPCAFERKDKDIIVTLPMDDLRAAAPVANKRGGGRTEAPRVAAQALTPRAQDARERIDAIKYLTSKGEKIGRIVGSTDFMLKGVRTPKTAIINLINRYRDNADLPPVMASEVE